MNKQQLIESGIRKIVSKVLLENTQYVAGYSIGDTVGDGSFTISENDKIIVRITGDKFKRQFKNAVNKYIK